METRAAASKDRRDIDLAHQLRNFERPVKAGALDDQRNVNGAFVRAALVFRIAGLEMAAVIADEHHDRVVFQTFFLQRVQ